VHLVIDGVPVAGDSSPSGGTLALTLDQEYVLSRGCVANVELTCDLRLDVDDGNYVGSFGDSTFAEFTDRDLMTVVYPVLAGSGYPLTTADVSVAAADLAGSFVNWPNPFNPDKEATTIGFVLPEEARVDIELFTITGELVRKIAKNAQRPEGTSQQDTWDGLNDGGSTVLPGTYLCRIKATYPSGRVDEAKRKIAVVR
jgi:hypothetical protein